MINFRILIDTHIFSERLVLFRFLKPNFLWNLLTHPALITYCLTLIYTFQLFSSLINLQSFDPTTFSVSFTSLMFVHSLFIFQPRFHDFLLSAVLQIPLTPCLLWRQMPLSWKQPTLVKPICSFYVCSQSAENNWKVSSNQGK